MPRTPSRSGVARRPLIVLHAAACGLGRVLQAAKGAIDLLDHLGSARDTRLPRALRH